MPREDEFDYRWLRTGWFDQGRPCDEMAQHAVKTLPGDMLPQRWMIWDFGEGVKWSKTASYHLLWISEKPILRIWTNAKTTTMVEIADLLVPLLQADGFVVKPIPEGTKKKRPEFSWRVWVSIKEELSLILEEVKAAYGVGNS